MNRLGLSLSLAFLALCASPAFAQQADDPSAAPSQQDQPLPDEPAEETESGEDELDAPVEAPIEDSSAEPIAPVVEEPSLLDQLRAEALNAAAGPLPPLQRFPYLEWHGYYRLRTALFGEADLGTYFARTEGEVTGTSLFLPPLSKNFVNASGGASFSDYIKGNSETTLGTATMRLRLAPVIHLSPSIRIGTRIDILDNLVLGSTPEYLYGGVYPGVAIDTLTLTQVPPSSGLNGFNDSLSVKEAWAEWDIGASDDGAGLALGTLKLGRFAFGWGLGLVAHSGDFERSDGTLSPIDRFNALDSDGGNYLDRIQWQYPFAGIRIHAAYAFMASGPSSSWLGTRAYGYDLDDLDDLDQIEVGATTIPVTTSEWTARRKALATGRPVFDWGVLLTYRSQDMATRSGSATDANSDLFSDLELVKRNAWLVQPDLFAKMDWRPDPSTRVYVALEAAALVGTIDHPLGSASDSPLDLLQWGGALQSNITMDLIGFGLDVGLASGDNAEYVAVAQGNALPWGTDDSWGTFTFNRNYRVDMLLYKEVLGGISNTLYVRPHFEFDLIPTEQNAFGGLISGIYGLALDSDATPGNDPNMGMELDAMLFFEEAGHFMATAAFGVLLPLWALDRPADYLLVGAPAKDSTWAWTFQGNLFFVF